MLLTRNILFAAICTAALILTAHSASAQDAAKQYVGNWALTIPGGYVGWLGVTEKDGKLSADILWRWGSVVPVDQVKLKGGKLILTRNQKDDKDAKIVETITAIRDGDNLSLNTVKRRADGSSFDEAEFGGKLTPPLPAAPDLANVKFGEPITFFNGKDLDGWELTDPEAVNGWSVKDGLLTNTVVEEPGKPEKNFGNLRTVKEFEDFNITLETNVPKEGNSGVYLRGIYEVQVFDSYGKPLDSHNMGAVYSRIKPSAAAEKPAGEWQTLDITLVDRHATVILNGKKIIDNKPILGCTGGALWSDPMRPGPIYLQGDHTGISYRNIVLRPVVK